MAKISKVEVVLDGSRVTGFSKFKENDIEFRTVVDTMDGDDVIEIPSKYGFSLTYLPDSGADIDWKARKSAVNITAIVQYVGGRKVTFTGCSIIKIGMNELDGKTAKEHVVEFHAKGRK